MFIFIKEVASRKKHTFISTAMTSEDQIDKIVEIFKTKECSFELMHCVATYPLKATNANMKRILSLKKKYNCKVGYSGHEGGVVISLIAVGMGITSLERHITLDRSMYGSDQSASVELGGLRRLVEYVRSIEVAMGSGFKIVSEKEKSIAKKLRRVDTL